MEELKSIVSKNIIYLRTNNKMTQLELGEVLNYSDKAVSKWERGEAVPDAYVLKEMGKLFDVSVDYLLTTHEEKELKAVKRSFFNWRDKISMIAFLGTWTAGIIVFAALWFAGLSKVWLVLIYTIPASFIVLIILSAVWKKRRINIFNTSILMWSIIASIFLSFLDKNWWFLFIIGIPVQLIIILSFTMTLKK